jgi:hypothetical protein
MLNLPLSTAFFANKFNCQCVRCQQLPLPTASIVNSFLCQQLPLSTASFVNSFDSPQLPVPTASIVNNILCQPLHFEQLP